MIIPELLFQEPIEIKNKKIFLHSNKHKSKIKEESDKTKSNLPPHVQSFKQKFLSGRGFIIFK